MGATVITQDIPATDRTTDLHLIMVAVMPGVAVYDRPYYSHGPGYYVGRTYYVWKPGHWRVRHGQRVWVHGHYVVRGY